VLTPAEWRVLQSIRHGLSNRTVANLHGISLDAVKFHVENIRSKLRLVDRSELRQWRGIPKHSALAKTQSTTTHSRSAMQTLKIESIGQISRSVSNVAQAQTWYRDVLQLTHLYTFGKLAFFDCGGTRLFLNEQAAGPESILYLKVADIHVAHATLIERGVTFVGAPHMIHKHADGTEEWMAFFNDPDGRPLALMCQAKVE
jgi:DNA-binding CsgD family transcriptional regulator/catechol 2,3-dioxygenase-like lactoylglutathione lyase family enzyme